MRGQPGPTASATAPTPSAVLSEGPSWMKNIPDQDVSHLDCAIMSGMNLTAEELDRLLRALEEHLRADNAALEPVIIGGSALEALGFIRRGTKDVDVLAFRTGTMLTPADPFPEALTRASRRVARDFSLAPDWLNPGPSELLRFGLPDGFLDRIVSRDYGPALTVHFAGRTDQIAFKLYAMVDHGGGRHEADLRSLAPSRQELIEAAAWTHTHDPSEGFRGQLIQALLALGVEGATNGA